MVTGSALQQTLGTATGRLEDARTSMETFFGLMRSDQEPVLKAVDSLDALRNVRTEAIHAWNQLDTIHEAGLLVDDGERALRQAMAGTELIIGNVETMLNLRRGAVNVEQVRTTFNGLEKRYANVGRAIAAAEL